MEPTLVLTLAAATLAGLGIVALVGLKAFSAWIDLKRAELNLAGGASLPALPATAARIDIADLKERIRKLEAIAAGVEL